MKRVALIAPLLVRRPGQVESNRPGRRRGLFGFFETDAWVVAFASVQWKIAFIAAIACMAAIVCTAANACIAAIMAFQATASPAFESLQGLPLGAGASLVRISVAPDGEQADGSSSFAAVSADGRVVVFRSEAENLAPGEDLSLVNVLARSIEPLRGAGPSLGETRAVGVVWDDSGAELSSAVSPVASADGRRIAFRSSTGARYGAGSPFGLFVHDADGGTTTAVDRGFAGDPPNGMSASPSLSADGSVVAFHSWADNLVPGDDNGHPDVFVHDLVDRTTLLISRNVWGTEAYRSPANGASLNPWLAGDGGVVVFESDASDLVADDSNGVRDIFAFDRATGTTARLSVGPGERETTRDNHTASVSADGRLVVFGSDAGELSPSAAAGAPAIHLHDRSRVLTTLVTTPFDGSVWGLHTDDVAEMPAISPDGRFVAFRSTSRRILRSDSESRPVVFILDRDRAQWLGVGEVKEDPEGGPSGSVVVSRGALGNGILVFSTDLPLEESDTNTISDVYAAPVPQSDSKPNVLLPWLGIES